MNRYRIDSDGRTAEQRRSGRKFKRPIVLFGETVFFRPVAVPSSRVGDDAVNMRKGLFVGHHARSAAGLVLASSGLQRGTSIHRLPEHLIWDNAFVETCKGLPFGNYDLRMPVLRNRFVVKTRRNQCR